MGFCRIVFMDPQSLGCRSFPVRTISHAVTMDEVKQQRQGARVHEAVAGRCATAARNKHGRVANSLA